MPCNVEYVFKVSRSLHSYLQQEGQLPIPLCALRFEHGKAVRRRYSARRFLDFSNCPREAEGFSAEVLR